MPEEKKSQTTTQDQESSKKSIKSKPKKKPVEKPVTSKKKTVKAKKVKAVSKVIVAKKVSVSKKTAPHKEEKAKTRIRIKIMAYDHKVIDKSTKTIIETARRSGAEVIGPIPLPMHIKKFTVLRSTFVHKDSRDQYEIRTHKRLIDIYEPTAKTMEDMQNLNLPAGVDIEVKM